MNGYYGRILEVDLNARAIQETSLSEEDCKKFIGGATLGAKLIYDKVEKGMDPLGPESPLVFAVGPFTGTTVPMVSRYAVCGISPLTGYWGEATSGGAFPFRLKGSGYDAVMITGRSEKPVYLRLDEGKAAIEDASHLWGQDSYKTQQTLKQEIDSDGLSVATIGPAGEKGLKFAGIMNDAGRAAGRCGLGALMGSKNLKAIAASGSLRPETADKEKLRSLSREATALIRGNLLSIAFKEYGTLMYMDMGMVMGDTPAKYFTRNVFPAEKITGQALRQAYTIENYACLGCPVACGREVKDFRSDLASIDGPEYETAVAFGPLCMNSDLDSIIMANHLCNVYGLDTISTGVVIAYAMHLAEQGALGKDQIGLDLKWGDGEAVVKLVEMIANQEGIGKILAKGTLEMAREFNRDPGEAAQVKGLEMPMHEARAFHGLAISYATGPRGACHLKGDYYNVDMGSPVIEYDIMPGERMDSAGKAEAAAKYQSHKDLFDALTLCKFSPLAPTQLSQILTAITGWECAPEDLLTAGDRSINLKRVISNKLGLGREGDMLPKICLDALSEGGTAGIEPDMDLLLKEYYEYRGWDWGTGRPTKEKLMELGLDQAAQDLYS